MKLTQWIKEEIKMKIRKYNEMNGNGNTTCQNVWDAKKQF